MANTPRDRFDLDFTSLHGSIVPSDVREADRIVERRADRRVDRKEGTEKSAGPDAHVQFPKVAPVEMQLLGLPDSSTVLIDGKETPVEEGKIALPGDGETRELKVIAKGYVQYFLKLAPVKDGELTLLMRKKGDPGVKRGQNKRRSQKATREKLMECPYCD